MIRSACHCGGMSVDVTPSGSFTQRLATEIKVAMLRRGMTGRKLALRLGVSQTWMSTRLTGVTPIDVNDLYRIAKLIGVSATDLVKAAEEQAARGAITPEYSRLAERWTSAARPPRKTIRPAKTRPAAKTSRPPNVRDDSRRPVLLPRHI